MTPDRLDTAEAITDAATLPLAIDAEAIAACTVDGSAHRKKMPSHNSGESIPGTSAEAASPSNGNAP